MTHRQLLAVSTTALTLTFGSNALRTVKEGSDRWDTKVLADDQAHEIEYTPERTTLSDLTNLKTEKAKKKGPRQGTELKTYRIECYIDKYIMEDDGDIHLVLRDRGNTMIGEIPHPEGETSISSGKSKLYSKVRRSFHKLVYHKEYKQKRFVITGVGFVDFHHGQTGAAPNNLELHPILSLEETTEN